MTRPVENKPRSLKKTLTIATAIMMFSVLLSRVMGFFREAVIAHYGGTSSAIDAYVTAFILPELLNHFLAGGFLSITFIPIFQRYASRNDLSGAWRSFSNLVTVGSALFLVVVPFAMLFAPNIFMFFGPSLSEDRATFDLTVRLTRIILPAQILFYWGSFFAAVQMAQHRFFMPALSPLCYNLGIILGGVVLGPTLGVEGFAWGVLAGAFAGNVLVLLPGALKAGLRYSFRFRLTDPDLGRFVLLSLPLVIGVGMSFSNEIFFRFFGSFLGEGGTASINYALRTTGMIVAVFGQASGVAFYPHLARLAAEKRYREITALLDTMLEKIGTYCIPLSAMLVVLAPQIISLLYERGAFDAQSTARTAPVFAMYMAGAFFFASAIFIVRPFYAMQRPHVPMIVGSTVALLSIPIYYLASREWGARGIAMSAVAGMSVQFIVLYGLWFRRFGDARAAGNLLRKLALVTAVSLVAAGCGWLLKVHILKFDMFFETFFDTLLGSAIVALPMVLVVLLLYEMTGVQKAREILRKIRGL